MRRISLIALVIVMALPTLNISALAQASGAKVSGRVLDPAEALVSEAVVKLLTSRGTQIARTVTNAKGEFEMASIPVGNYLIMVDAKGWSGLREAVEVSGRKDVSVTLHLSLLPLEDQVTVTASPGEALAAFEVPKAIATSSEEELRRRPAIALPQALRETPSVHVQQTTTSQGSVYVRGLTGQRVVSLIDGIRYNNSTFRPGPTQYLATVPIQSAGAVEVVQGPASVQYGSDGLGGTVNVLTQPPFFSSQGIEVHGRLDSQFGSADMSGGGGFRLTLGSDRFSALLGGSLLRANDLRAGGGLDSHAAVTRFLGISSRALGDRLQDTAFSQYGGEARIYYKPAADQQLSIAYIRNELRGNRRYDQLNGGNGNLVNDFIPQTLDFFYARYQKQKVGLLDSLTGTFSFNRQGDDRRSQGGSGNPLATITKEFNTTDVFGYNILATAHTGPRNVILIGSEFYDEYIDSSAFTTNPATGQSAIARGRFPDQARFKSFGFYTEDRLDVLPGLLRLVGGVRYGASQFKTRAEDSPIINGRRVGLDASTRQDAVTFNAGFTVTPYGWLALYGTVNRGFRIPNVNDLGGVGISSNGFTITAEQAASLGGEIGSSADGTARSTGVKLSALEPESVMNYEGGVKVRRDRFDLSLGGFVADLSNVTAVRAVVFPGNIVGKTIAGQPIISQSTTGAVFVESSSQPVISRVNSGEARFTGIEASSRVRMTSSLTVQVHGFYLRSRDKDLTQSALPPPGVIIIRKVTDAPDFEGGLPPMTGFMGLQYQPRGKRYWLEIYSTMAGKQDRLSSVDLNDQRQGATRSRANIAAYFNNGARARGLTGKGADGTFGTADDILLQTGETLAQVQNRVLGVGIISAPLFLSTSGYATVNLRGGLRAGENSNFIFILENLLDKNYRIHGSGTDAAGINMAVRYQFRF